MNSYCKFYIVRHGQTQWNVLGKLQGHADSPLTQKGINQAKEIAEILKDIKFEAIFSSDLLRAKRTAEIIKRDRAVEVATSKLLRERNLGSLEGESVRGEAIKKFDALLDALKEEERPFFKVHPDVETDNEIATRLITFIRETAVLYPEKSVLVVTHSAIMRALLVKLGFGTTKTLPYHVVKPASCIELDSDGVDFFIRETIGIQKEE